MPGFHAVARHILVEVSGSRYLFLSSLQAILRCEAAGFGAMWYGGGWSRETMLCKPPSRAGDPGVSADECQLTGDGPAGDRTWCRAGPGAWAPVPTERGPTRPAVLHIRDRHDGARGCRATGADPGGGCVREATVVCAGDPGFVYGPTPTHVRRDGRSSGSTGHPSRYGAHAGPSLLEPARAS